MAIFRGKMIFQNTHCTTAPVQWKWRHGAMGHEVPPQRWVMEDRQQTPHGFLVTIGSPPPFGTNPNVCYPCLNGLYNMIYVYIYMYTLPIIHNQYVYITCHYIYIILHNYTIVW